MDAQEIFDTALFALRKQGELSMVPLGSTCAYRGEGNTKCAVGHLIDDAEYDPAMERYDARNVAGMGLLPARLTPHIDLLMDLQNAHDSCDSRLFTEQIEWRMELVAAAHGLVYAFAKGEA